MGAKIDKPSARARRKNVLGVTREHQVLNKMRDFLRTSAAQDSSPPQAPAVGCSVYPKPLQCRAYGVDRAAHDDAVARLRFRARQLTAGCDRTSELDGRAARDEPR